MKTIASKASLPYVWEDPSQGHKLMIQFKGCENDQIKKLKIDKLKIWRLQPMYYSDGKITM